MTANAETLLRSLERVRAVPVLRSASVELAVETGRELAAGGLNVVEVTFSVPDAPTAISRLAAEDGIIVGAGTVLSPDDARRAVDAGAAFLVSPVWLPWLPELADALGVPAIPGAASPSEVWAAHSSGAAAVKVFPIARLGGAAYVKDLLAPMPGLTIMATGGADRKMAADLLAAGCGAVGLGSVDRDPTLGNTIRERAATALDALKRA